ncbi:helix-turn-helix transcriptional regulator [Micromonospora sp. NBC_01739]|uniref:helix-turn-helix transcriptional regulator n=1 Tax=Micromonospora sp. NBC_01739 TaxID=2975985 RepID=UPI002E157D68|nr:helix-turn-helix transcriptional regulator [Micromonospora sp. NBC_01739]
MKTCLAEVLSAEAAALYQRLLAVGTLPLHEEPMLRDAGPTRELIERGFARERHVGRPELVPVEPVRAMDNAILLIQRQITDRYEGLLRVREEVEALQQHYLGAKDWGRLPEDRIRVLTDGAEIGALSVELCLSARRDVMSIETEHFNRPPDPQSVRRPPAAAVARGVTFRNIYTRGVLDLPGSAQMLRASVEAGWQCRIYPELPMKMVLVDGQTALLPLGPTGMEGAMLVRTPVIASALRTFFDLLWHRAVPVTGTRERLSFEQDQVLRLLLTGMIDKAIARHLGISERTVRRHVGALMQRLGANNRVTLAATAVREGWAD